MVEKYVQYGEYNKIREFLNTLSEEALDNVNALVKITKALRENRIENRGNLKVAPQLKRGAGR